MIRLEKCIEDIRAWMGCNYLKLNDTKTEFQVLGGKADLEKVCRDRIRIGESLVKSTKTARNIGAHLDTNMDMKYHISTVVRSCYHQIRLIAKIRKFLTIDSAKKLIHAFVTSRLDNLNSLLVELPDCAQNKLQAI